MTKDSSLARWQYVNSNTLCDCCAVSFNTLRAAPSAGILQTKQKKSRDFRDPLPVRKEEEERKKERKKREQGLSLSLDRPGDFGLLSPNSWPTLYVLPARLNLAISACAMLSLSLPSSFALRVRERQ